LKSKKLKTARKASAKFKVGDIVVYLNDDYEKDYGFFKNSVTKITRGKDPGGHYWVKNSGSGYEQLCVELIDIRKATKLEIVTAKLLGKYVD
jgi:hypothetical protein